MTRGIYSENLFLENARQFDWLPESIHATDIDGFISRGNRFYIWDRKTTYNRGKLQVMTLLENDDYCIKFPYGQMKAYQDLTKAITNVDARLWIKDSKYMDEPDNLHVLIADMKDLDLKGVVQQETSAYYVVLKKDQFHPITLNDLRRDVKEWGSLR